MRDQNGYETMGKYKELWELDSDCEEQVTEKHKEFMDYHVRSIKTKITKKVKKVV